MKIRKVNIMMVVALLAMSGCSTVPVQQLSDKYDRPILSAAEATSMIRVTVAPLESIPDEQTVVASTSFDSPR